MSKAIVRAGGKGIITECEQLVKRGKLHVTSSCPKAFLRIFKICFISFCYVKVISALTA